MQKNADDPEIMRTQRSVFITGEKHVFEIILGNNVTDKYERDEFSVMEIRGVTKLF